jgi:F0F1-type ATP synthase membrane subunit b/b'
MTKLMIAVFTGLFVMGVCSVSFAEMLEKAVDATEQANTVAKDAKATADSVEQKSIEAQDASNQEAGSIIDQTKETAKETVNETVNETIDNLGK